MPPLAAYPLQNLCGSYAGAMLRSHSRRESFESGKAEGRKEGLAEGREEGEHSAHIKIARKMKAKGKPLAEIAELTGLSEEEIERL